MHEAEALTRSFAYLHHEFGLELHDIHVSETNFGSVVVEYRRTTVTLQVTSDRQVFIELTGPDAEWRDKDDILEEIGIARVAHPTRDGLRAGYSLEIQSAELRRQYFPHLLSAVEPKA